MDPLTSPIQAKLVNSGDLLDATPGALPVYFGSEVEIQAEQLSGVILAGNSESTFWLDTRPIWEQQTQPTVADMQQVFVIESEAMVDDETAEALESSIVTNQDSLTYWTNFDTDGSAFYIDQVTAVFYVLGLILLLGGVTMIFMSGDKNETAESKWADDLTQPETIIPEPEVEEAETGNAAEEIDE